MNSFIQSVCCFSTCICEDICIPAAFRQLLPQLDPHGHVYFYNYYGSLNRVCICSRECLPAPLVYVLGNTIWPQVLSVYLKPSVSVPILIVSRVSSRLASPLIIRAMWRRRCLERVKPARGGQKQLSSTDMRTVSGCDNIANLAPTSLC